MIQTSDQRLQQLENWLQQQISPSDFQLIPLAADASFRRYFRIFHENKTSLIAMDAPPAKEDSFPFMAIANMFAAQGLSVPKIMTADLAQGFLLISDLGNDLYFRVLNPENADRLYKNAINQLPLIQTCQSNEDFQFTSFETLLLEELQRFREWFLHKHLELNLTINDENLLNDTFQQLITNAMQQPQVCIHRDYHSRNLLVMPQQQVGILDFQDAMWGPLTYDLVSLIRDCYIAWPNPQVEAWAHYFYTLDYTNKILQNVSWEIFLRWFDWMGIQRHLKAIYIFARKFHRDQNANYLNDIPRTLNYVTMITKKYPELKHFDNFLKIIR